MPTANWAIPPSIPTPLQQRAESLNHNEIRGVNKASRKLMGGQNQRSTVFNQPCRTWIKVSLVTLEMGSFHLMPEFRPAIPILQPVKISAAPCRPCTATAEILSRTSLRL